MVAIITTSSPQKKKITVAQKLLKPFPPRFCNGSVLGPHTSLINVALLAQIQMHLLVLKQTFGAKPVYVSVLNWPLRLQVGYYCI